MRNTPTTACNQGRPVLDRTTISLCCDNDYPIEQYNVATVLGINNVYFSAQTKLHHEPAHCQYLQKPNDDADARVLLVLSTTTVGNLATRQAVRC